VRSCPLLLTTSSIAPSTSPTESNVADSTPTEVEVPAPAPTLKPLPMVPDEPFVVSSEFSDCVHPGVTPECNNGWCRIPAGGFIMGSPEHELHHARLAEDQARVTLSHDFEIQEIELTLED
jgi:hypothetical protein